MNQFIHIFLLLVAAVTSLAACASQYQRFAPPGLDFVFEYPSGWKQSPGLLTVNFFHPEDKEVEARIRVMPLNREEPRTAEEYLATTIENIRLDGGHLDRKEVIQVSGHEPRDLSLHRSMADGAGFGVESSSPWSEILRLKPVWQNGRRGAHPSGVRSDCLKSSS